MIPSLKHVGEKQNQASGWRFSFVLSLICILYVSPPLRFHLHDFPVCSSYHTNNASTGSSFSPSGSAVNPPLPFQWAVFPLSSTSHPPQWFLQGPSPLNQSSLTACPGTPYRWSAQQHTGLSDEPPDRGPSTPLWKHTLSGCPAGGAVEFRHNQSIILTLGKPETTLHHCYHR